MLNSFRKLWVQDTGRSLRGLMFFTLLYLYLWFVVQMRLIYHGGGTIATFPVFLRGWEFFQQFLSYPGGVVEYASAFLAQLFYYSWAGAGVVTLQAWLIYRCTYFILKAINAERFYYIRFVPPILLLVIYGQYAYQFTTTVALLAALGFVCLYLKIRLENTLRCLAVYLLLSVILYYIAAGAYLLFAVMCGIYELFFERRLRTGLLYLFSAVLIPYIEGVLIFGVSSINAYSQLLPLHWSNFVSERSQRMLTVVYPLYLLVPAVCVLLGVWRVSFGRRIAIKKRPGKKQRLKSAVPEKRSLWSLFQNNKVRWVATSLVLLAVTATVAFLSFDSRLKATIEVDYYTWDRMWDKVIEAADRQPEGYLIAHAVDRALYHKGRLGYDMFRYPQYRDTLLLDSEELKTAAWNQFGAFLDLGYVTLAELRLANSMEAYGRHPVLLKNLVLVNLVQGDFATARMYLNSLNRYLFHSDWARDWLARLDSGFDVLQNPQIRRLRELTIKTDYGFATFFSGEESLLDLLKNNKNNQMAFEYLMTRYMLYGKLEDFARNLGRLDDFGYERIPPLYEEAILLYLLNTQKKVNLGNYTISKESQQRCEDFRRILYAAGRRGAFNKLAKDYGDSYLFYYTYGVWVGKK